MLKPDTTNLYRGSEPAGIASKDLSDASLVKLTQMLAETVLETKNKRCMHLFKKLIQRGLFLLNVAHGLLHFKSQSQSGNYLE